MSFVKDWQDWHASRERYAGSEYGPWISWKKHF